MSLARKVAFLGHGDPPMATMEPLLRPFGMELMVVTETDSRRLSEACKDAEALIVHGSARISAELLDALPSCRVVARTGVGVDAIDVTAATDRGVMVCNAPGGNTVEVADQTMALILCVTRKIFKVVDFVRSGRWGRPHERAQTYRGPTHRLKGRTLAILGLGRIGQAVARRAQGFGLAVIAFDPYVGREVADSVGTERVGRDELFQRAHILTLHCPISAQTRREVGERELSLMPRGGYLINAARGGLVDTDALVEALRSGHLDGAGLDVTDPEPLPPDHPLLHMDNVIVTAHTAANSEESFRDVCAHAALCVAEALQGGMPSSVVNAEAWAANGQKPHTN